ncbi:hypothetical protein CEUSTIGMA_g9367.t1 [Chlamydomonas eustigma]|uniref:PAZ domain-containing protein n=1 Tax=Chlamydomonas eustigma TaxID=1157962 RepID=A0A250XGA6_9CHLO|nr:hypothetical protein CEUSTIGMA_g9367.t1 [Chlamydomonas eustigma]|eukprot:GAX81939.1 hypothetical protein CEUSTIGMA_g9367.t1 [Chlamydomonas eustigma]
MSYERREEQDMNSGGRRGWRRESDRGDISQEQPRRSESSSERPSIRGEIEHHEGRSRQEHDHRPGFEPGSYREGRGSRTAADPPLSFSRPAAYPSSAQQLDGSGPHAIQSLLPPGFHEPIHSTSEPRQHLTDTKGSRFNLPDDSQRRAPPTQYQQEVGGSSSALSHAEAQQGSRSSTSRPHHTYEQGVGRDWNEERGPYDKRRSTGGSGRETGQPRVHRGAGGGHHTSNSASSSALPTTQRGAGGETGSQGARYQGYHSRSQPSSSTAASPLPFVSQETRMQLRLKSEKEDYSKHKKHAEIAPLSHGDPIYVLANHFKMNLNPKVARMLQRYHVEVVTVKEHVTAAAEAPGTGRNDLKALKHSLKRKVVSLWMSTFHPEVREGQWSFDGDKILWTTNQSPLHLETRTDSSTSGLVRPQLSEAGSSQEGLYSPLIHESNIVVLGKSRYQVKMTREGSLDLFNALSAINDATEASKRAELMQVLDIVLRHSLACLPGAIMKGTAVYLPPPPGQPALRDMDRNKFKIGLGALAWRGFRACMNLTASEALTLTMDTSMTAVIEEQNLCTYVAALLGFEDGRGSPEQISEDAIRMRKNVERDVKGLEVEMRPRDGLTRLRRIKLCSLSELTARTYKFAWKQDQGRETSIEEYYFQRYGIQLRYPKLPVVQCRPKSSDYVPMELLTVLFQPMVKRPSPVQNSKLISASAFKPEEKIPFIIDSLRNKSKLLQSETFKEFGLSVDAPDTGRDSLLRKIVKRLLGDISIKPVL